MLISVLVCTYNRPLLLGKCLESIFDQITKYEYEVIVVDNDERQSAKEIVQYFEGRIEYIIEPNLGLANVRNKAVEIAKGEYILFIDDDEVADFDWIENMVNAQHRYNADAVFGQVYYKVPNHFPSYIRSSIYFNRKKIENGKKLLLNEGYCGNTLVRRSLFQLRIPSFNPEFNNTGGEDSDFFNFLIRNEYKLVFCSDAKIVETQDENRKSLIWFYKRAFNSGVNYTSIICGKKKRLHLINTIICVLNILFNLFQLLYISILSILFFNRYFLSLVLKIGTINGKIRGVLSIIK